MRMTIRTAIAVLGVTAGACAFGCGGRTSGSGDPTGAGRVTLRRAQSCDELREMLAEDAIAKANARIDREIGWLRNGYGPSFDSGFGAPTVGAGDTAGSGGAAGGAGGAPVPPNEQASSHSDTNTQVVGVDEADIVKTDGEHLFLLHGQSFEVLDAWPAASLAKGAEVAIEGQPFEMFVDGGRAVVYSTVDGTPIYQAANVTPKPAYSDYGYGYGYATGAGGAAGAAPDVGAPAPPPGGGYGSYAPLTKVTVLRLEAAGPVVDAELYFEGDYLSSRRVGDEIRTVLHGGAHGPVVPSYPDYAGGYQSTDDQIAAWEALRAKSIAAIRAAQTNEWLPYQFVKSAGVVTATTARCDEYYVPTAGSTRYGLTQLEVFDATAPTAVHGVSIVGDAETVYSNATALYVAAASYEEQAYTAASAQAIPAAIPMAKTHLHKFDLASSPGQPRYAASGTVVGTVKDQFSLDERDGFLRVATTEDRLFLGTGGGDVAVGGAVGTGGGASVGGGTEPAPAPAPSPGAASEPLDATPLGPTRVNHLFVLAENADELTVVGSAGDLAPEERIYSTRFVGDRGYVVTFRQVDPLFVIDLSVPTAPTVLAELKIPGFSEYMHPLDDGHLLTIGKDTVENQWGGVQTNGLALQIFDVRDAKAPKLVHKLTYADPSGSSAASYDHKAFTYFADRKLLAFPYVSYGYANEYSMRSSLEVFSIDAEAGIAQLGSVDHSSLVGTAPNGYCGGYYGVEVRRGVFLDDFVYSISYGGVVVNAVADFEHPVASLALPAPVGPEAYCGGYAD